MKFDRKARVLLLYVCLPLYVALLGVFVYVSNVYRGKYALPKQIQAEDFVAFASKGYVLAQEASVSGHKAAPGMLVDEAMAEALVKSYGVLGREIAVVESVEALTLRHADASEASSIAGEGMYLVYPVSLGSPPTGVQLEAGTELTAHTAARIEKAAAGSGMAVEVAVAAAEAVKVPESVESQEFSEFLAAGYLLDEPASIAVDGDIVEKQEGTVVNRTVLVGLMRMRDAQQRPDWVKVRGEGPVIGFQYTFVFVLLNFAILVLFLYGLLWKPVLSVLDQRRKSVSENIEQAKAKRQQAHELFEKYRKTMEEARGERERIIADGKREGEEERQKIVEEAKGESDAMLERARLSMESDRKEMEHELTTRVGAFSVQLASRILEREIKDEDHNALVDDFTKQIGSQEPKET